MSSVYNSIMAGLAEAVEDANGTEKKLSRRIVSNHNLVKEFPFVKTNM